MGKKREKRVKEAIKQLFEDKHNVDLFRDIFGMKDYSDKDVKRTFKKCVVFFMENNDVDPDEADLSEWMKEQDEERGGYSVKSIVKGVHKKQKKHKVKSDSGSHPKVNRNKKDSGKSPFDKLLGRH